MYEATPVQPPWRSPGAGNGLMRATSGARATSSSSVGAERRDARRPQPTAAAARRPCGACRRRRSRASPPGRSRPSAPRRRASRARARRRSRSTSKSRSRAARCGSTSSTTSRRSTFAPHCVSRYGSPISSRTLNAKPGAGHRARQRPARRQHRGAVAARGDRAVGAAGGASASRSSSRGGVAQSASTKPTRSASERRKVSAITPPLPELGVLERAARGASSRGVRARRSRACGRCTSRGRPGSARRRPGRRRGRRASVRSIRCSSLWAGMTMSRRTRPPGLGWFHVSRRPRTARPRPRSVQSSSAPYGAPCARAAPARSCSRRSVPGRLGPVVRTVTARGLNVT